MSNHVKPSKEELQANIDASLKELNTTPPEPPKSGDEPPATPPANQDVDWEKKFSASSREAQVQGFKLKAINEAYEEAAKITDITEDELKKENPDWDDMTETEKRLAKSILITAKKNDIVNSAINKFRDVDEWDGKISTFIEDPKTLVAHPELEGKSEEFKSFASKPTRRGVDFEDLVLAFSGEQAKNKPAPKKGEMFPTGSGGQKEPPKPKNDKLSPTESRALMQSDYKKWKELLLAGKIANE